MTKPLLEIIRPGHEAVGGALSDMGHALALLEMLLEDLADPVWGPRNELMGGHGIFLVHLLQQSQRDADQHLRAIWTAAGGVA